MLRYLRHIAAFLTPLFAVASPLGAEDTSTLELFGVDEPVAAASRTPRPVSKIAENVTVITADQIALLNAHTLSDVLNTISGVQIQWPNRTPGSNTDIFVQGAEAGAGHVLVLLDGVQYNNYLQGWADVGQIPVQQIERVEIVKGAASAIWGPALGGVINVISKAPGDAAVGGDISASIGERTTNDTRGEITGTAGRLGYYLSGGRLKSRGLLPNNDTTEYNGHLKLSYKLPSRGSLTLGGGIWRNTDGDEGLYTFDGGGFTVHDNFKHDFGYSFLTYFQPLNDRLSLEVTTRGTYREGRAEFNDLVNGEVVPFSSSLIREITWGGGGRISWGDSLTGFVTGIDLDFADVGGTGHPSKRNIDRFGLYANGFYTLGPLTVIPGLRYDRTSFDDSLSTSLGATFRVTEKTVLRAYGAQGYGLPNLVMGKDLQKVWTVQMGAETTTIPYLWLKGTLFYNRLRDAQAEASQLPDRRQTKQGFEVEARTAPWQGLLLTGGYTFNDSRDGNNERHRLKPSHIGKLGLLYDNPTVGIKGTLTGSYVWWNSPAYALAKYDTIIWDLHLVQKLPIGGMLEPEIFFSARNLFDGAQYRSVLYQNASRWIEGGVRFRFSVE